MGWLNIKMKETNIKTKANSGITMNDFSLETKYESKHKQRLHHKTISIEKII
jgi:hypothetical protein